MPAVPDTVDHLLIPLDPTLALQVMASDFDRFANLDPRIREAGRLFQERLEGVTTNRDALDSVLWLHIRDRMLDPIFVADFRRALDDPDVFLRNVEFALETGFTVTALEKTAAEAGRMSQGDSQASRQLAQAREELDRVGSSTDASPLFGITIAIACACAALCYCIAAAVHYLATH